MNPSITLLTKTAGKPERMIVGLMSGTSLDGLDVALCKVSGSGADTEVELINFETHAYTTELKTRLKAISSKKEVSLEEVCLMHTRLGEVHAAMILDSLKSWKIKPEQIDCIASHGQTIYHAPQSQHRQPDIPDTTLQIGDGDHIAVKTGILTISDFRQKHTAAGGEGAPMVSLVDRILFGDKEEERILLNIGGIANFSWLPALKNKGAESATSDTGPGNTLIDAASQRYYSRDFDHESRIALKGSFDRQLLRVLKSHEFFQQSIPKTTGPEVFNLEWVFNVIEEHNLPIPETEDLMATLTRFSAETITDAIKHLEDLGPEAVLYVSGGGIHNPLLMKWIRELLPDHRIRNFQEIGFEPDAKEAVLFAVLANEVLTGRGFVMDSASQKNHNINFGKISFPE